MRFQLLFLGSKNTPEAQAPRGSSFLEWLWVSSGAGVQGEGAMIKLSLLGVKRTNQIREAGKTSSKKSVDA